MESDFLQVIFSTNIRPLSLLSSLYSLSIIPPSMYCINNPITSLCSIKQAYWNVKFNIFMPFFIMLISTMLNNLHLLIQNIHIFFGEVDGLIQYFVQYRRVKIFNIIFKKCASSLVVYIIKTYNTFFGTLTLVNLSANSKDVADSQYYWYTNFS